MTHSYLFGPVASRRLGRSLGIDLTRPKTCSLDCVYCEAGATTKLTTRPEEFVPVDAVIRQLDAALSQHPALDYVTFSGSGEPTLNARIGEVVTFVKTHYPEYPLCLLTNAVGLSDPALRRAVAAVDLVIPSLDASNAEEFERINRPAPGVTFDALVAGLTDFAAEHTGAIWLELFVVPGVNDSDESIARFRTLIARIHPALVQLNTLDRPGVLAWVEPAPRATLERFIRALEPVAPVEAVGRFRYRTRQTAAPTTGDDAARTARILALALRRPVTAPDVALALDEPRNAVEKWLEALVKRGELQSERLERGLFFSVPEGRKP